MFLHPNALAACIPFDQARNHLDETQCVTGKVIRVQQRGDGVHYLDFCEDYRLCTFTVVVFPHDLKNIGDVRGLAGKVVEITGEIKDYDERAQIVLENPKQLNNDCCGSCLLSRYQNISTSKSGGISAPEVHGLRVNAAAGREKEFRVCLRMFPMPSRIS